MPNIKGCVYAVGESARDKIKKLEKLAAKSPKRAVEEYGLTKENLGGKYIIYLSADAANADPVDPEDRIVCSLTSAKLSRFLDAIPEKE